MGGGGGGENSDFLTLVIRATDGFLAINLPQASACLSFRVLRTRVEGCWGCVFRFLFPPAYCISFRACGRKDEGLWKVRESCPFAIES